MGKLTNFYMHRMGKQSCFDVVGFARVVMGN